MKRAVCILVMLTFQNFYSQNNFPEVPKDYTWLQTNQANLDISEVTFVNWNAGGSNSISALVNVLSELRYQDLYYKWRNSAKLKYGINKQENQRLRKTEDELELISNFGFRNDTLSNWYVSGRANFKTQFTNGYKYPNRDNEISKFMAPGYLFLGGGVEYGKNLEKFSVYMSPLTLKATFVLDADLSNAGAFGVTPAVIDANGNILQQGERVRTEMGILITNFYEKEIFENIRVRHNLSLYSDYINNFGNIDVDWEVVLDFRVNQYVKATLGSHIKYDNDIKILEETATAGEFIENGAKVQWKQLLGVGVVFGF